MRYLTRMKLEWSPEWGLINLIHCGLIACVYQIGARVHTRAHANVCAYTVSQACMHTRTHTHTNTHTPVYSLTGMHAPAPAPAPTRTHAHPGASTHACRQAGRHACKHWHWDRHRHKHVQQALTKNLSQATA